MDPMAVEGHLTEVDHPGFFTEFEHLREEGRERLAIVRPKVADRPEVRLLIVSEKQEGDGPFAQSIDSPGTPNAVTVGEHEDFEKHHRMEAVAAPAIHPQLRVERVEPSLLIKDVNGVRDELFETVLFDPVSDVFRREHLLVLIIFKNMISHWCILET